MRKIILTFVTTFLVVVSGLFIDNIYASEAKITVESSDNGNTANIRDGSYNTTQVFSDAVLTVKSEEPIKGLYIEWECDPAAYTVSYNGIEKTCGTNGFWHEYIELDSAATEVKITLKAQYKMCDIYAYTEGELPKDVQRWEPSCEKADILVLSTHADDEVLFLGGVLAEYAGEQNLAVQVIYFSKYNGGAIIREHEKLDGLWAMGVRHYPENGNFEDLYSTSVDQAKTIFGYEKSLGWLVEMIRKYKPLVCVTQDVNGEYGHGTHMFMAQIMQDAVNITNDAASYPESAQKYGVYEVPKTYLHLYGENKIHLDTAKSLQNFDGKNAVEVASEAYKKHVSQQWCWFYVSDTNEYSIADFGLYKSTVGNDTSNDMMENVVSYEEQERIRIEEEQRIEASKREEESKSIEASEESEKQSETEKQKEQEKNDNSNVLYIAIICACLVLGILLVIYKIGLNRRYNSRKK